MCRSKRVCSKKRGQSDLELGQVRVSKHSSKMES